MTAATQTLLSRMRTHLPASAVPWWDAAQAWLAAHAVLVSVIGGLSVLLSVAGLALTPFVIARLPADFFLRLTQPPGQGFTGRTRGTGPRTPVVTCSPTAAPCGVANASGALVG